MPGAGPPSPNLRPVAVPPPSRRVVSNAPRGACGPRGAEAPQGPGARFRQNLYIAASWNWRGYPLIAEIVPKAVDVTVVFGALQFIRFSRL